MDLQKLVKFWFTKWEEGDFENIPIEDNFIHISPYGKIDSKTAYLNMVRSNKEAFLGGKFEIHDEIYDENVASVTYTIRKGEFSMEVSEWFFKGKDNIQLIKSYYNVNENISYEKNFSNPNL